MVGEDGMLKHGCCTTTCVGSEERRSFFGSGAAAIFIVALLSVIVRLIAVALNYPRHYLINNIDRIEGSLCNEYSMMNDKIQADK